MTIKIGEILKGDTHVYVVKSCESILTVADNKIEIKLTIVEV